MIEHWIRLQKEIGINEIKFYVFYVNYTVIDYLKDKFKNYIHFFDQRISYNKFCDILKLDSNYQIDCEQAFKEMKKRFGHQVEIFNLLLH
jgi:NDP-sugar pyrophosphorylase family protein